MMEIHIFNQHAWPDGAPSAILEEQLADNLSQRGYDVSLVVGSSKFRTSKRPRPITPIIRLRTAKTAKRDSQLEVVKDYIQAVKQFQNYIRTEVKTGDVIIATSSPFTNVFLANTVKKYLKKVTCIYHMHDYLPSSLASISRVHKLLKPLIKFVIDRNLNRWDLVIKLSNNLAYRGGASADLLFLANNPHGKTHIKT